MLVHKNEQGSKRLGYHAAVTTSAGVAPEVNLRNPLHACKTMKDIKICRAVQKTRKHSSRMTNVRKGRGGLKNTGGTRMTSFDGVKVRMIV